MTTYRPPYYSAGANQRWVFSYADILTILLVLFIALAAQGLHNPDANVLETPPATDSRQITPEKAAPVEAGENLLRVQSVLEKQGLNPKLEPRGLVISLSQAVLFPSGQDQVSDAALPVVGQIAEAIRGIPNQVVLIGHTDAVPIHNRRFRDNLVLSVARGLSLLEILNKQYDIQQSRLSVAGYGAYCPREPNDTEESRAANRRVEIVIQHESTK